jgi:hypothetical protein
MPPTRKTSLEKKLANATVTPDEVYKYLTIDKGLSHEHAMGMLPNIVEESEFIYNRIQNDAKYDPDHSKGKQGIGLFQYTEPTRRKNFVEAVPDWQTNWKGQIDFALSEPETKRYLNQSFDTLEDASRYFTTDWERPRNRYRQAEKRLDYVPGLIDQIEAQNTKPYASETFQSYVMPPVNVVEFKDSTKEYIDLNSDDIINDLALAGQQMNYFAQGGARNANNMKRYYATGGVRGNADREDQIAAYNKIVEAAKKAGSPDPYLTASIAMLESGWMTSNFAEKNNPFGQTALSSQVGKKGITKVTRAADGLLTAEYDSLDSAIKHHIDKWGEYYVKGNPEQSLKNLVDNSYNVVNPNWASTIYTIHTGPTASEAKRQFSLDTEVDNVLDPTAQALGLPTSEDVKKQLQAYNDIKAYEELAASDPSIVVPLPNPNYDPDRSIAEQYLEFNPELVEYFQGAGNIPSPPSTDRSTEAQAASRASGYEGMSAEELQNIYQGLLEADAAAAAAGVPPALVSGEFEEGPQAPQFLARRMQGIQEFPNLLPEVVVSAKRGADFPMRKPNMLEEDAIARDAAIQAEKDDYTPMTKEEIAATIRDRALDEFIQKEVRPYQPPTTRMAQPSGNYDNPDVRPKDSNFLSKLKGQDYMGLLTDIGAYAARMAPLQRALRDASSYDEERYPRFAPIIPTATLPKRDVRDAFATAQQAALQQGKLDLGALSALATQQAKETARVEENVANERVGLLNQAQQLNNQITMQEMADTAANKGAAQTMKYQALAAMSEMGQGSLREANMRRNDAIVKEMFSNVFGDEFGNYIKDKYSKA